MIKRKISKSNQPESLLQWLIFLAALGITLSSPIGTRKFLKELYKVLVKQNKNLSYRSSQISRALYYLKKQHLINLKEIDGEVTIVLTEKGEQRKLRYDFNNLKITPPRFWDGKWRLLMFDVPESKKVARESLREKIKNLGFLFFQKSIWLYPYPCEDEIDFITEIFSIGSYVNLLTVKIENDELFRAHFKL